MTTNTDLGQKTKARLDAWQNSDPKCHNVRTKRDFRSVVLHERQDPVNFAVAVGCIITGAQVFLNEVNRGALAPWTRIRQAGQGPIAPEAAGAGVVIQQIRQRAEPLRRQMGLDIEGMTRLIISALWNLFEQIYGQWLMDDTGSITVSPEDVKADYCSRLEGLKCSDELCKGTNNKCDPNTPFKGCKCDDDEPQDCPSKEPLHCVNCGGVGEKDRCQGVGSPFSQLLQMLIQSSEEKTWTLRQCDRYPTRTSFLKDASVSQMDRQFRRGGGMQKRLHECKMPFLSFQKLAKSPLGHYLLRHATYLVKQSPTRPLGSNSTCSPLRPSIPTHLTNLILQTRQARV